MNLNAPLFVSDADTLEKALRLSAVPDAALDTEEIVNTALLSARIRFYRELGESRVNAILTTAYTDLPTTDAQILRAMAAATEVLMVRASLMRTLPTTFMDASGDIDHRWNEEAPIRESSVDLSDELERLEQDIADALSQLADPTNGSVKSGHFFDGTPDSETTQKYTGSAPRVGQTLKEPYRRSPLTGNELDT